MKRGGHTMVALFFEWNVVLFYECYFRILEVLRKAKKYRMMSIFKKLFVFLQFVGYRIGFLQITNYLNNRFFIAIEKYYIL